ncbi:pentapeptide repeat-containing protein [Maricaulis sp.]|uniref:pentapeptide repeat-containing protein n=1 Tax=Maricaulis sp. TaxID=1486257 RepID=UPI003A8D9933
MSATNSNAERTAAIKAADEQWWKGWWAADFSWEGLAKHDWQGWSVTPEKKLVETVDAPDGSRQASLQDYYRWDWTTKRLRGDKAMATAKLLDDTPGQPRFHILHVPERWQDGSESWKTDATDDRWASVETELLALIQAARPCDVIADGPGKGGIEGADRRTQLAGAQLRNLPRPPASPPQTLEIGPESDEAQRPGQSGAWHLNATRTRWLAHLDGQGAVFGSPADFSSAQFSGGNTNFQDAQFSGGDADFRKAQFSGGDADFGNAQFSGGHANFINAQFSGGYADFKDAQFSGGDADFRKAQFSGGTAYFIHLQFSGGNADFTDAQFSGGHGDFHNAQFEHAVSFRTAVFHNVANFSRSRFPAGSADRNRAFVGVRFKEPVMFAKVEHLPFSAFDDALLEKGIVLTAEAPRESEFRRSLRDVRLALNAKMRALFWQDQLRRWLPGQNRSEWHDFYGALEGGCRVLKQAMKAAGDSQREQQFYRYELIARRKRPSNKVFWDGDSPVSIFEKGLSWIYGLTAGYGASIARPLFVAAAASLVFAAIFSVWARGVSGDPVDIASLWPSVRDGTLWQFIPQSLSDGRFAAASEFALQNLLRPFGVWLPGFPGSEAGWAMDFKANTGPAGWNWVRIVASIQSFFSIVMLFLSALALRRKFQIS